MARSVPVRDISETGGAAILRSIFTRQATPTPKVRAAIQGECEPASVAGRTVRHDGADDYKWRHRDSVLDRRPYSASVCSDDMTPRQEAGRRRVAQDMLLSLDDCLAGVEVSDPDLSRAPGLDRCLRRRESATRDLKGQDVTP